MHEASPVQRPSLPSRYPFQLCIWSSHSYTRSQAIVASVSRVPGVHWLPLTAFCPQRLCPRPRNSPFSKPSFLTRDSIYSAAAAAGVAEQLRVELPGARPVLCGRCTIMTLVVDIKKRNRPITLHSPNVLHSTCGKQETVTHILLECKNTETPNQIINKTAPLGIKLNLSNILTNELLTDIIIKNLHKRT